MGGSADEDDPDLGEVPNYDRPAMRQRWRFGCPMTDCAPKLPTTTRSLHRIQEASPQFGPSDHNWRRLLAVGHALPQLRVVQLRDIAPHAPYNARHRDNSAA